MKRYLSILLICWLFLGLSAATSQAQDRVRILDTVEIQRSRLELLAPGHHVHHIDSFSLSFAAAQSVADVLATNSDVFIKHYGLGSLATTSLRGGSASHTALIWNGFNLQSPMNGQQDLALLPAYFIDDVQIQYGGSSGLYGSGAVGGAIHLSNRTVFNQGFRASLNQTVGSFGLNQPGLDLSVSGKRWMARSRAFLRTAENDFLLSGLNRTQPHARLRQQGFQQELAFLPGKRQLLQLWMWTHQSDRQLPPPLTSERSAASQQDQSRRIAGQWSYNGNQMDWNLRSAWVKEELHFSDSIASIFSNNISQTWIQEVEQTMRLGADHKLHIGLNSTIQTAGADGYGKLNPSQFQIAAFVSYLYKPVSSPWIIISSIRQGRTQHGWNPTIPAINVRRVLWPGVTLRGQAGRSFRLPTFNDLYWSPGGNRELQPESGWNQDVGVEWDTDTKIGRLEGSTTTYSQTINNWILWRPGPNFWYPENLRNVWSRGIETDLSLTHSWKGIALKANGAYTFTKATITEVAQGRDLSLGKQLIYTPAHQFRSTLRLSGGQWSATYSHRFTGKRYTATDNSAWLDPFDLASLSAGYSWTYKNFILDLAARVDNLWAVEYQVIDNRAMPLRSGSISLNIHFQTPFRKDPT